MRISKPRPRPASLRLGPQRPATRSPPADDVSTGDAPWDDTNRMHKLPHFDRTRRDDQLVTWELHTARYIRTLWAAASAKQRAEPEFLLVLARCAWVNNPEGSDDARVRWVVSRQVVEFIAPSVSCDHYPIAAKISCVVVDSNGVVGSFIDSALK
ncbi:MAG: hypothetical protein ABR543_18720 [Gemmatimonadaceae bacterium]